MTALHPECCGAHFPALLHLPEDQPAADKNVFAALLQRAGGMWRCAHFALRTPHLVPWSECQQFPGIVSCGRFWMARLDRVAAIRDR